MSKTLKKNIKKTSSNYFEDGYHSKQKTKAIESRKQSKQFENALRSRDLKKMIMLEENM